MADSVSGLQIISYEARTQDLHCMHELMSHDLTTLHDLISHDLVS